VIGSETARWVLSAVFVLSAAWFIADLARTLRAVHPGARSHAVAVGWHVLMCAAMLGMVWPWGTAIPPIAQVVVFTGAAAWFVGRAVLVAAPPAPSAVDAGYGARLRLASRARHWYHAAMMAAMVWMAVAMSVPLTAAAAGTADAAGAMAMTGMSMPASPSGALRPPAWVVAICLAAGLALGAAAAWLCISLARRLLTAPGRPRRRHSLLADAAGAATAAGMAAVLFAMA
jgi:Domain of unknown function (DUF5134)